MACYEPSSGIEDGENGTVLQHAVIVETTADFRTYLWNSTSVKLPVPRIRPSCARLPFLVGRDDLLSTVTGYCWRQTFTPA